MLRLFLISLSLLFFTQTVLADEMAKTLRFGVLSFRPKEITTAQWLPLAKELEQALPGYSIELLPLNYSELDKAAKEQQLDFVLTNPEHYILLKNMINMNAVATLIALDKEHPQAEFAGVIFTRADREDIKTLADLNDKKIAAPVEQSLGGYLMERWELEKNNIVPKEYIFTGMPHDKVVDEVLAGNVDAGFVRSGILESLEKAGKIQLSEPATIRVLASHEFDAADSNHKIYSVHSTQHYPEWAFSVRKNLNSDISRNVSLTLLNIKPDSDVAKAAGIAGFNAPADYTPVEVLMLRLRAHPDELKYFNFEDVIWRYREGTAILLIVSLLIFTLIVFLIRANRKSKKIQERLNESYVEISLLLNSMAEGAYGVDKEGFCTFVNTSFLEILGYDNPNEIIGQHIHELIHHSYPDRTHYPISECKMYQTCQTHQSVHVSDEVFWRKDAVPVPVEYWSQPIIANGVLVGAIATFNNIAERQKFERELQESTHRLQTIIDINPECIQMVDEQGNLLKINSAGLAIMEADSFEQISQKSTLGFVVPEHRQKVSDLHKRVIAGETMRMEFEIIGLKGTRRWLETNAVPMIDNGKIVRLAVTRDISERKKTEEVIKQLAFFDPLTNLPNRRKLLDRLNYTIALSHREDKKFAVFMMDLDKFKMVNDKLGHAAGDDLLKQVATRIPLCLRESDMVARLGGDEFVVVLEHIHSTLDTAHIAKKIIDDLTEPFTLSSGDEVQIGVSIGISFYPQHGNSAEKLIDNADTALYLAKENGRGCFAYYEN